MGSRLHIELRVRLSDGSFDSHVQVPTDAPPEERDRVVASWMALLQSALAMVKAPPAAHPTDETGEG